MLLTDALHDQAMLQRLEVLLSPHETELLNQISLNDSPDKLIWLGNTTGDFSAKDLRRKLTTPSRLDNVLTRIWQPWLPPKISTFIWRLRRNAIAMDDRVQSCGIHIVSKCRCCPFLARESSDHLFVHSHSADEVWKLVKRIFNGQVPRTMHKLWSYWFGGPIKTIIDALRLTWACYGLWEIWKKRNHLLHETTTYQPIPHIYKLLVSLAPLIKLPHMPSIVHNSTLVAMRIKQPYTTKVAWKTWCPFPNGLTLYVAWRTDNDGPRSAFMLRQLNGATLWLDHFPSVNILVDLCTAFSIAHQNGFAVQAM
ncbi:hypothetical protein QQ045_012719 [Rhodiola kirilowii]